MKRLIIITLTFLLGVFISNMFWSLRVEQRILLKNNTRLQNEHVRDSILLTENRMTISQLEKANSLLVDDSAALSEIVSEEMIQKGISELILLLKQNTCENRVLVEVSGRDQQGIDKGIRSWHIFLSNRVYIDYTFYPEANDPLMLGDGKNTCLDLHADGLSVPDFINNAEYERATEEDRKQMRAKCFRMIRYWKKELTN